MPQPYYVHKPAYEDQNQLGSELLAKFLQSGVWDGWNGSSSADIWESQEMMALINETIFGSSTSSSGYTEQPLYDKSSHGLTSNASKVLPYYGDFFQSFHDSYFSVHGYLALVISVFGVLSNIINIAVLTRKNMITPTNAILTALAIVDVLVMITYIPFALHQYILWPWSDCIRPWSLTIRQWRSYGWMVYIVFNIHFTIICHTISVWLTITLAVFRYIAVTFPSKVQEYCSMKRAIMAIAAAWICTVIMCTPSYLSVQVGVYNDTKTLYRVDESDLSKNNRNIPRIISFYAFSVLAKLVPCFVLTFLSIQLVRALVEAERRRFLLKNPNGVAAAPRRPTLPSTTSTSNGPAFSVTATETTRFLVPPQSKPVPAAVRPPHRDRTTRMLLAILVFFLITEFPSGLVALFSCFSQNFFLYVYGPLGDLMDILALINSSINFILYCSMSRQFRKTFCHMFVPKVVTVRWKNWKGRQGGIPSSAHTMTERTITYYPGTKTTYDRRPSYVEDDMGKL